MTTIVISGNHILVDDKLYVSLDYEAYSEGGAIGIRHMNQKDLTLTKGRLLPSEITLNGVAYATAILFVNAFNSMASAALSTIIPNINSNSDSLPEIEENTNYPDTLFSGRVDTAVASTRERIFNVAKPGYIYIRSSPDNAQNVFVGTNAVIVGIGELLEPGDRVQYEIDDLSKIYIISVSAGQQVHFSGAYKE